MEARLKILAVVGTRPEAIKMAPVIQSLRREPELFEVRVCATAQHRDLLDSVLGLFQIRPDIDLDLMRPNQTLNQIAAGVFENFGRVLLSERPDWVLVQGDTTTVMAASLTCFHADVRVGHVEAGLRTADLRSPFPEELNRRVTDLVADKHFAPTERSVDALRREGVPEEKIHLTGNTVVDALQWMAAQEPAPVPGRTMVLVTAHRRENFGEPMRRAFRGLRRLAVRFPDVLFIYPVHPNPNVMSAAETLRGLENFRLTAPVDYRQLVSWIRAATLIITDSGGIQEEAPTFGKPTLVLRDTTERPEGIEAGVARLVGTDEDRIFEEAERLLTSDESYAAMAAAVNPYGDGKASDRITDILAGRDFMPFRASRA